MRARMGVLGSFKRRRADPRLELFSPHHFTPAGFRSAFSLTLRFTAPLVYRTH